MPYYRSSWKGQTKRSRKVIIKRYGINCNILLNMSGADVIRPNRKNKTLIVIGEKESFATFLNQVDLCCKSRQIK